MNPEFYCLSFSVLSYLAFNYVLRDDPARFPIYQTLADLRFEENQ